MPVARSIQFARIIHSTVVAVIWLILTLSVSECCALDIEETEWGFGGSVTSGKFNVLSILVNNPSDRAIEGELKLSKAIGGLRRVGGTIHRKYFVSPYSSRWIQFYPYVTGNWEEWQLTWGESASQKQVLTKPGFQKIEPVLLVAPDELVRGGNRMRRFRENLFPINVAATTSLTGVVLDHVPRWEGVRKRAFLSWLHLGGTVHILKGAGDKYPTFTGELSVLNTRATSTTVGSGVVILHDIARNELTTEYVDTSIIARPDVDEVRKKEELQRYRNYIGRATLTDLGSDMAFFNTLKSAKRSSYNWILIYLFAFLYVLMIFPGCYVLGRNASDYRLHVVALLATVLIASVCFYAVGRRSGDESMVIRSLSIANEMPDGQMDLTSWSEAAVTIGGYFSFQHSGEGTLFSTASSTERVNAEIVNSVNAQLDVDIPPYSSRTFIYQTQVDQKPLDIRLDGLLAEAGRLQALNLTTGDNFPDDVAQVVVLYNKSFYRMVEEKTGGYRLVRSIGTLSSMAYTVATDRFGIYFDPEFDKYKEADKALRSAFRPLICRQLGLQSVSDDEATPLPQDRVRVFVYAKMPQEFLPQSDDFDHKLGYVLYVKNIPLQGQ